MVGKLIKFSKLNIPFVLYFVKVVNAFLFKGNIMPIMEQFVIQLIGAIIHFQNL